ncbi:Sodium/hydrogen exchanger, partial [Coemansia reversa NRRL 1564]
MVSELKVVPAFLGGFICIYGLISGFVKERLFLSEALVAMVFGILLGPQVINVVDPGSFLSIEPFTREFARYVIAIQVMAAGITLPGRYMVRKWRTMSIMLGPVMIVMWLVTAGIIHLMFQISFKQSLLIASCAAPTDPILANSVVKGRYAEANVPKNVRDALSAESGVNDGLGLPFLYFALYLLDESYSTRFAIGKWFYWIWCYNILLSVVIGIVVGYIARKLLRLAEAYDLIDKESFLAFSIGLSIFIVGCLQLIKSDDVLCCFIAGHSFTWDDWFREETKDAHFQEVLDGLINVTFFVYFGTIIPWDQFNNAELVIAPWRLIVAAIMVLFLRRLPVVLLLTRIIPAFRNYRQSLFAGWFGPIGVGAIFFAEIVLEEIEAEPEHFHIRSREIIQPIVCFLIFSSVLVHGITLPLLYIGKVVRSRSRSFST